MQCFTKNDLEIPNHQKDGGLQNTKINKIGEKSAASGNMGIENLKNPQVPKFKAIPTKMTDPAAGLLALGLV